MMALSGRHRQIMLALVLACCLPAPLPAAQAPSAARVFGNEYVSVQAELDDLSGQIVHFGDVLTLSLDIAYDPDKVRVKQPDSAFFTKAWPQSRGPYLLDQKVRVQAASGAEPALIHAAYRFQILACPDEQQVVCRGTRQYALPDFTLEYQVMDGGDEDAGTESASFRPWPPTLIVTSAIPLGEEGELFLFSKYFPNGGYPGPLSGTNESDVSLGLLTGGLVFLLGGVLMSPFGFLKKKRFGVKPPARWEQLLQRLRSEQFEDDAHFLDAYRRCLIWYCNDELDLDPFDWIRRPEEAPANGQGDDEEHVELHKLFIDAIHNPAGQHQDLLERLDRVVRSEGRGPQ